MENRPDVRLGAIKATDVILAALQAAFGQDNLLNGTNPYRFVRDDPKASWVWVCDPESRMDERDGNHMIVMVSRAEYTPQELHLFNLAGSNFSDTKDMSDLAVTNIFIQCEAGNKTSSEVLASIVYNVIKLFRLDLMKDFDIHSIKLMSISPPVKQKEVPGEPWLTTVTIRIETQESCQMVELANHMNHETIAAEIDRNQKRTIVSLDSTPL